MTGPEEASADMRQAARAMRDMYVALIAEGFTVGEAVQIIGTMLGNAQRGGAS